MMSLGNREGRATMKQSRKTYRISYAGAPMVRATASCDGQDGRLFSCENAAAPLRDGFFVGVQRMYVYGMEEQQ